MPSNTDTLKPCPFCGGAAAERILEKSALKVVGCRNGCLHNMAYASGKTLDEAIAAWNTRAQPSLEVQTDGLVKRCSKPSPIVATEATMPNADTPCPGCEQPDTCRDDGCLADRVATLEAARPPVQTDGLDWSKAERGKFYRPSEETLARIGEAAEGAVLSEMTWPEIGEAVLKALSHSSETSND